MQGFVGAGRDTEKQPKPADGLQAAGVGTQWSPSGIKVVIAIICKNPRMQLHTYRDLLRDIMTRLVARGRNNLRTTIAKVAVHTVIEGNERADAIAKRAAAPDAGTALQPAAWQSTFRQPVLAAHLPDYCCSGQGAGSGGRDIRGGSALAWGQACWPRLSTARRIPPLSAPTRDPRPPAPLPPAHAVGGGSNLNTVYESAWRAANAGLHGGLSNVIIWDSSTFPHRFQPS